MNGKLKTLWTAFCILLLLHVLALAGGVMWLSGSGRLNKERLRQAIAIFKPTLAAEQAEADHAKELEAQAKEKSQQTEQVMNVAASADWAQRKLDLSDREQEMLRQQVDRWMSEKEALLRQLEVQKELLEKQRKQIVQQQTTFEEKLAAETSVRDKANFDQVVAMYEQIKPAQAKLMFQDLLAKGQQDQVVDYLAAMQLRKAAAVLKEFKAGSDIAQVASLVQRLRMRGVNLVAGGSAGPPQPQTPPTPVASGSTP